MIDEAPIQSELEALRAQLSLAKDLVEARLNPFFAFGLQAKVALTIARSVD